MKQYQIALLCGFVLLLVCATVFYIQNVNIPILEPAGPVAAGEKNVILVTFFLCCLVIVPVFVMLFVFAWRYRESNPTAHEEHRPTWDHYNWIAEVIWWVIPGVIIAILGVIAVQSSNALDPFTPLPGNNQLTIDVIALDWKWLFMYPEQGIASVNLVEFPVNTPVHFYLTADAPMNSFWIPQLAGQIMVMPGMTTQLNLAASRSGDFNGFSGNISGAGFSAMAFTARAVSEDQFNAWISSVKASSTPLTVGSYDTLAQPSEYNSVAYYAPIADVFDATIMRYMTPGSSMSMEMSQSASPSGDTQGMDMSGMHK